MGAEGSKGAKGGEASVGPPRRRSSGGTSDTGQLQALQERIRDLEASLRHHESADAGVDSDVQHISATAWHDVLAREPTIGTVRLTQETCAAIDALFAVLDVNGDGVLSSADIPTRKNEVDARGRSAKLFQPLSDFLVRGEMTREQLRRALAVRAARQTVAAPGSSDTLVGWIAAVQREANRWVQQTVHEVLYGEMPAPGTSWRAGSNALVDVRPRCACAPLAALVVGFGNLGFPTSHEAMLATAELPLWVVQYGRMSLGEAFHIARVHAERSSAGCYVSMQHVGAGTQLSSVQSFRERLALLAGETAKGEAVTAVLMEPSTAFGRRNLEGSERHMATVHAALLDAYDETSDEVTMLDAQPQKYGLRWRCSAERLHLACNALQHDAAINHRCAGGIVSLSRVALASKGLQSFGDGQNIELMAAPKGHIDCFSRPSQPQRMPSLSVLSPNVPCRGLMALSAALSVLEHRAAGREVDPGTGAVDGVATAPLCPTVDELCYTLNLGFQPILDNEQPTLAQLADLGSRWISKRSLPAEVMALHCDDRICSADSLAVILRKWQHADPNRRPVYLIQFDSTAMSASGAHEASCVCLSILVNFDETRSEVTLGEVSVRHSASSWISPLDKLWRACAAVGSIYRSGGLLQLSTQDEARSDTAVQYCAAKAKIRGIELPQFTSPIAATGLTSIAYALEALFQVAAAAVSQNGVERTPIPTTVRRPVSVDDVAMVSLSAAAVNQADFSMAETFDASARYVAIRSLPVRVDAIFCDGSISESAFREELLKRAISSGEEVLVLHFDPNLARGIKHDKLAPGSSALVLGYDKVQDEVLLADTNPKMYRMEWRAPVATVYTACCAVAPYPIQRARGAIRYSLYTRHHAAAKLEERMEGSGAMTDGNLLPLGVVSTLTTRTPPAAAVKSWQLIHGPEALSAVAMGIFLAMGQNEICPNAVEVARVCEMPVHCAFASDWQLADLAAVARRYIELMGLPLAVQHVEFAEHTNPVDRFTSEMERTKHVVEPEAHIFAFAPSIAHSAPNLEGCDYAVISSIDITSSILELTDMNPKKNCMRWSVHTQQLFDAVCAIQPPGSKRSSFGMLRIHRTFENAAQLMFLSPTPERPLILTNLTLSADTKLNHGALILQTAFARQLKCNIDVLLDLSVERITSHDESLPELRDLALRLAHQHLALHDFTVDTVFCEPEHCSEENFSLEMRRHCEATSLGFLEASILHFNSSKLFGLHAAAMGLQRCDWAMCVAADEETVSLVTFDGIEHKVSTHQTYLALSEKDGDSYVARRMGFFRIATVTSAQVHAAKFETEKVDGPVAWALSGKRLEKTAPATFEQQVITEENMLHPPEHHFASPRKDFQLGNMTLLASLVPVEFTHPVPCSSLVAIGMCCDALLELSTEVGTTDSGGTTWWQQHQPATTLDYILRQVGSFSLGITQAMDLKASAPAAAEVFQRRAPSPVPPSTVSVGLVHATLLANQFFSTSGMGLIAEVSCFSRASSDGTAFKNSLSAALPATDAEESPTGKPRELLIVFFRADIVHTAADTGGCTVAIVVGYLQESDTVLLLNTQPKKFGRFSRVSVQRLRNACTDETGPDKAQFGFLRVRASDEMPDPAAQLSNLAPMPRTQRLWRRAIIMVRFVLRIANSSTRSKTKTEALMHWRHLRQHMPCNGLASLAYALSATGVATSVMSIVTLLRLPIQLSVTTSCMPDASLVQLGQLTTIAQHYIAVRSLPLKAAGIYFDMGSKAERCFKDAVTEIACLDAKDMLILNFDAALVRTMSGVERNGWGILSEVDSATETLTILNPVAVSEQCFSLEVGIGRMTSALGERDDTVRRARGVLHICRAAAGEDRAQLCADVSLADSYPSEGALSNWMERWPASCHQICGAVQHGSTTMHGLPCHALTALSMALTLVGGSVAEPHSQDKLVQRLALPPHIALRGVLTLGETASLATEYIRQADLPISVELIHFDIGAVTRKELVMELQRLHSVRNSASAEGAQEVHIGYFDVDRAHGHFGLTGGESHHAILLDFDTEGELLMMADPYPARFGQLWTSQLDNAYDGLTARDANGRAHGLVRLARTDSGDRPMSLRSQRTLGSGNLNSMVPL